MDRDTVVDVRFNQFREPVLVTRDGQIWFGLGGDMHLSGPPTTCNNWGHILIAIPPHADVVLWHETPANQLVFEIRNGHPLTRHIVADVPLHLARQPRFDAWLRDVNDFLHSPTSENEVSIWLRDHPRP